MNSNTEIKNPFDELPKIIKTARLELRVLDITNENASLFMDAFRDENPKDYFFAAIAGGISKNGVLPETVEDAYQMMKRDAEWTKRNGRTYYVFYNDKLVGLTRVYYLDDIDTLQIAQMFLHSKVWGKGFAKEIYKILDVIAFEKLHAHRITVQCDVDNIGSKKSIETSGFHLDGISPDDYKYHSPYATKTYGNKMFWSKMEYNKK